jgi:hypothetical protein
MAGDPPPRSRHARPALSQAMDPKPAPLPPPTIRHLRDISRLDAVLLSCNRCAAAQSIPWADLGLPDETPFPAIAKSRAWQCQRCDGTDIGAMPDWRSQRPAHDLPSVQELVRR